MILRDCFHVCPVCGNVVVSTPDADLTCHGHILEPLQAKPADIKHSATFSDADDEWYVEFSHPMTKEHYIVCVVAVYDNETDVVELYPEGSSGLYLKKRRLVAVYCYCNIHGLFKIR